MLKSILNLRNVQPLSKKEQKNIKGGDSFMCLVMCGPGDGNIPIYDYDMDSLFPEEVGCFCV